MPGRDPEALFHVRRKQGGIGTGYHETVGNLVAANFSKILQVHELLMERRRIDGKDIVGIIELMPNGPVIQEDAA